LINPANFEIGSQTTWHPALAATLELAAIVAGIYQYRFVVACRRERCSECANMSTPI
jgi:hypothetical protein